jgi:hypothetical protein
MERFYRGGKKKPLVRAAHESGLLDVSPLGAPIPFSEVYLVSDKRLAVPPREIDDLASWLPVPLPSGYRDYLTALGVGTFCDLVDVHPPKRVRDTMQEHHGFIAEYYRQFWGRGEGTLPGERAMHSVRFATSHDRTCLSSA